MRITLQAKPPVRFGNVHVREFSRMVGGPGIPRSGAWPLALSAPLGPTRHLGTVDSFEDRRQHELKQRAATLHESQQAIVNGETRQFDFKASKCPVRARFGFCLGTV